MSNNSVLSSKYANIENLKVSNISGNLPFNDNINVKGRLFLNQTKEPEYDNEVVTKKYVDERVNTYTNDLDVITVDKNTSFIDYNNLQNTFFTHIGGSGDDLNTKISIDDSGNVYMAGVFRSNELNIYDSTNNKIPVASTFKDGDKSLFLTKYNDAGVNQWKTKIGGYYSKSDPSIYATSNGNIYVALLSYDDEPIKIYDTTNDLTPVKTLPAYGEDDANTIFVKYDTNGIFKFNLRITGFDIESTPTFTSNTAVAGDLSDNIYIAGYYYGIGFHVYDLSSDLVPSFTFRNENIETQSYFIVSFDKEGNFRWANHLQGGLVPNNEIPMSDSDYFKYINIGLNCDSNSNLYLTSSFYDDVSIFRPFIKNRCKCKYDCASVCVSDCNNLCYNNCDIECYDLSYNCYNIDCSFNIFNTVENTITNSTFGLGCFTIKFNNYGQYQYYNKILTITGENYIPGSIQTSNCVDRNGNLYLCFSNLFVYEYAVFDSSYSDVPVFTYTNNTFSDSFVALLKFNNKGLFEWNNNIKTNQTINQDIVINPTICCDNRYIRNNLIPSIYIHFNGVVAQYNGGFNFYNSDSIEHIAYVLQSKDYYFGDNTVHSIIAKYNENGNFQWASTCAAYLYNEGPFTNVVSNDIKSDKEGHIYISGSYWGETISIFDVSTNGTNDEPVNELKNDGDFDCFLIKYNRYGLINDNIYRNIYIEDTNLIPNAYEKSIVITNNQYNGLVNCNIMESIPSEYKYNFRRTITLTDALDLVCNDGKWIPKVQVEQINLTKDLDVIDINSKLSVIDYNQINNTTWSTSIQGLDNEQNCKISTDLENNLYMIGTYTSNVVNVYYMNNTNWAPMNKTGNKDIFITKYKNNGSLSFLTKIQANLDNSCSPNLFTDEYGNSYITFVTADNSTDDVYIYDNRDNFSNSIKTISNINSKSTVIVKYDKNGIFIWNILITGYLLDTSGNTDSISVVDKNGNLFVSSYFRDGYRIIDSAGTEATSVNHTLDSLYLIKFNSIGKFEWTTYILNNNVKNYKCSISIDNKNSSVIVSGIYNSNIIVNNIVNGINEQFTNIDINNGNEGNYLISYNTSTGKCNWATVNNVDTTIKNIVSICDYEGNIYLAAQISNTTFYMYDTRSTDSVRNTLNIPTNNTNNIVLIKYNKNGIIQWYTFVSGFSELPSLTLDNCFIKGLNRCSIYMSGSYTADGEGGNINLYDAVISGQPSSYHVLTQVNNDSFLLKYFTDNGELDWTTKVGGSNNTINSSIAATSDGHIYLAGEFNSGSINVYQGLTFGLNPNTNISKTITNSNTGTYDIFLIKYNRFGIVNNNGNLFGRELYLENRSEIPDGTEKTIIIANNVQNNNNVAPTNICLMIIDYDDPGYTPYRTLWFAEGVTMISYGGKWIMKSSSTGDGLPKRSIVMWGGDQNDIPAGWALCDGSIFHGVTTPDLRGRFVLGYNPNVSIPTDSSGSRAPINLIGNVSGELNHELKIGEIPAHKHGVNDDGHSHVCSANDAGSSSGSFGQSTGSDSLIGYRGDLTTNLATTGITNKWTGGHNSAVDGTTDLSPNVAYTETHNNMPPYFVLAYIMKCY